MSSKLFTVNGVQNIENNKINCSSGNKFVNPIVFSVYPLALNLTDNNLITTIHEEQLVNKFLYLWVFLYFNIVIYCE